MHEICASNIPTILGCIKVNKNIAPIFIKILLPSMILSLEKIKYINATIIKKINGTTKVIQINLTNIDGIVLKYLYKFIIKEYNISY